MTKESKNHVVFGIYQERKQAEAAIDSLKAGGFRNSDVSLLMTDKDNSLEFKNLKDVTESKASEGAATGITTGAVLGGTLGWLVGMGALAIPGIGPLVAAGPIMAALAGVGIGGTVGGIGGALIGFGIPDFEAQRYEDIVKHGGTLLMIHADDLDWAQKAKNSLELSGASDISMTEENRAARKAMQSSASSAKSSKSLETDVQRFPADDFNASNSSSTTTIQPHAARKDDDGINSSEVF